jgi:hypothetical protein
MEDRQYNGKQKKRQKTNNGRQNDTHKTKCFISCAAECSDNISCHVNQYFCYRYIPGKTPRTATLNNISATGISPEKTTDLPR